MSVLTPSHRPSGLKLIARTAGLGATGLAGRRVRQRAVAARVSGHPVTVRAHGPPRLRRDHVLEGNQRRRCRRRPTTLRRSDASAAPGNAPRRVERHRGTSPPPIAGDPAPGCVVSATTTCRVAAVRERNLPTVRAQLRLRAAGSVEGAAGRRPQGGRRGSAVRSPHPRRALDGAGLDGAATCAATPVPTDRRLGGLQDAIVSPPPPATRCAAPVALIENSCRRRTARS